MTVATHIEGFQIPLGQVLCEGGEIVDYCEKPTLPVRISSGAYVLASRTCTWIDTQQRTDIPDLIPMLQLRKEKIASFEHDSIWIDINDKHTLERAEELVNSHHHEFGTQLMNRSISNRPPNTGGPPCRKRIPQ